MIRRLLVLLLAAVPLLAADWHLFTSFRKNGETGVYFALSNDGRKWTPLNNNEPWIKPQPEGMLMRDPCLSQGPDGIWHMVWTWHWYRDQMGDRLKIGYSSSKDLVTWTHQREILVMPEEPTARNAWAPEAVWDSGRKEWVIFWATTIPGKADGHRLYFMTTKDWMTFKPAQPWFDPGFSSIDSTLVQDGNRWIMVFKDERDGQKRLRLAFSDSPQGPWTQVTEPFSRDWVEGPSVARIGEEWWIYFDHYTKPQGYGAIRTRDWKTFEDVSDQVSFPADHRHGAVVKISEELAKRLQAERH